MYIGVAHGCRSPQCKDDSYPLTSRKRHPHTLIGNSFTFSAVPWRCDSIEEMCEETHTTVTIHSLLLNTYPWATNGSIQKLRKWKDRVLSLNHVTSNTSNMCFQQWSMDLLWTCGLIMTGDMPQLEMLFIRINHQLGIGQKSTQTNAMHTPNMQPLGFCGYGQSL